MPAVLLPESARLRLAAPAVGESLSIAPEGAGLGEGPSLPYAELILIATTWVFQDAYERAEGAVAVEGGYGRSGEYEPAPLAPMSRRTREAVPRLDLVAADGRRLRFVPLRGDASALLRAIDELARLAPGAHLDWGSRAALDGEAPLWARFDHPEAADAYLDWQAQLALIKRRARYGRPGGLA